MLENLGADHNEPSGNPFDRNLLCDVGRIRKGTDVCQQKDYPTYCGAGSLPDLDPAAVLSDFIPEVIEGCHPTG